MKKVFISYSRRNLNVVERLARDLQDAGLEVWVDFRKIKGGEAWRQAIYNGIDESEFVIACLSAPAAESEWVRRELEIAQQQKKLIIPVMLERAFEAIEKYPETKALLDVQIINFAELNYERAFPTLLSSLPGRDQSANYDDIDPSLIPNPFKGLESFQETDNDFFFGRETLIEKAVTRLYEIVERNEEARFMAFVGASGSGKSSVVRAGIVPAIRSGRLPGSDDYPIVIFKPGNKPVEALASRLLPLIGDVSLEMMVERLGESHRALDEIAREIMSSAPPEDRFTIIIDQFEEVFTRVEYEEQLQFLDLIYEAVTSKDGRALIIITMRADFFDRLSRFPLLAALFGSNNLMIVADMSSDELRRTIEGPAIAVGLVYDHGLPDRILEEVLQQTGSLPLLQYALSQLFEQRDRRRLTWDAYNSIGGVRQALARHAETVYRRLNSAQQDLMQRLLLRLVEVGENGEATRRRVRRDELNFERVSENALNELLDLMTSASVRLLVSSREIRADKDPDESKPIVSIEVIHEALIREWARFQNWVRDDEENLRLSTEILKTAQEWENAGRDASYLLTQSRLDRALVWVQTADASQLQRDFINLSAEARRQQEASDRQQQVYVATLEEASRRRLRLLVAVLFIGILISVAFLIRSLFSEQAANAARELADTQARLIRSRSLSQSVLDVLAEPNTPLALALAIEANSFDNPPPVAQSVLAEAAYLGPRHVHEGSQIDPNIRVLDMAYFGGEAFALGASEQILMFWDIHESEPLWLAEFPDGQIIQTAALSSDGRLAAGSDETGQVLIWNVETGAEERSFNNAGGRVWAMAFRPEHNELALASNDGRIYLWDVGTGTLIHRFEAHVGRVLSLAFSADGSKLASGGVDNSVRLWDVDNQAALDFTAEYSTWIRSVTFNPAASRVVAGASDGTVLVWDTASGGLINQMSGNHQGSVVSLDYAPNGESFVSAASDGEIIIWDSRLLRERHRYSDYGEIVSLVIYNETGTNLVSVGDAARIIEWDVQPGAVLRRFEAHMDWVLDVGLSPDGQWALSGGQDGDLLLWNVQTGAVERELLRGDLVITSIAYSPNGETALVGLINGDVLLWDSESWEQIALLDGHTEIIRDIVYSPDGRSAATAGDDGRLLLWDIESQILIRGYEGHNSQIWSMDFTPDGLHIMFGDEAGQVGWWDTHDGNLQILEQGNARHGDSIRAVAISADGRYALSAGDDLTLIRWEMQGEIPVVLNALEDVPNARIVSISFSPDGRFALTASDDRIITMWELESGEIIRRLQGHVDWVNAVEYSQDGRVAISASADRSLILWRIDSQAELLSWTINNREIAELSCQTRRVYSLEQQCGDDDTPPVATAYPLGTMAATSTTVILPTLSSTGTATQTIALSPTPEITESLFASATPVELVAALGENAGTLAIGGTDIWRFDVREGDILTIRLIAENPRRVPTMEGRDDSGFDTVLTIRDNEGNLLAGNDDIELRQNTNSEVESLQIAASGTIQIIVESFNGETGGAYQLLIERQEED